MSTEPQRRARRRDPTESREAREEPAPPRPWSAAWMAEWVRTLLFAALIFVVLRTFFVESFVISSGSMEETLLVGDFLMVNRLALGSRIPGTRARLPGYADPARGDVIVFDPPHEENMKLVKRLVGLPGDTLTMRDGVLHVGTEPLDEPYVRHRDLPDEPSPWMEWQRAHLVDDVERSSYQPTRDNWGPLVIPDGHYFMLGDNREASLDSRYWGLLERWRLEGRASLIYFSYDREALEPFPIFTEIRWNRVGQRIE